jgi:cytochrome c oxidase assembly protein subunit 15
MHGNIPQADARSRTLRVWLYCVAAMIVLTLAVGGATRLTESGLSIVEWKPVTGAMPPLTSADWQAEFAKYQTIPQYRQLNRDMSLDQFKIIYWWEWAHRLLARSTGAVFLLPFLFFLWRGWVPPNLKLRLWAIFGGGAALGAVGWWMVSSGVTGNLTRVSQYRLAFHLTLACAIYAAVLWTAQSLSPRKASEPAGAALRYGAAAIAGLLFIQIYLGALVAGLDAGLIFNTWPQIDGAMVPAAARLWFIEPAWRNLFENTLTVQFDHRMLAYAIWAAAIALAAVAWRQRRAVAATTTLAIAVTLQAALGIATLLRQAPLHLAMAHQLLAIAVFTIAIVNAERLWPRDGAMPLPAAKNSPNS